MMTTACPICRGVVTLETARIGRGLVIAEHVDQTRRRCEGSFAPVVETRCQPCSTSEHGRCQGNRVPCSCSCGDASDGGRLG